MYKIANWDGYENHRTRNMQEMRWVPIPNRFDGDQISEIIDHGAAVYGVWVAVLLVASRCDPRGVLTRADGEPHTPKSLARRTRIPQKEIEKALPIIITAGLIELCDNTAPERQAPAVTDAQEGQAPAGIRRPGDYGIERIERKERKKEPVTVDSLTIPDSIDTPEVRDAIADWLEYKRGRSEGYKKAGHLNGLLKNYSDPAAITRDIRNSIGCGYKGLIQPPASANNQPAKKQIFKYIPTKQVNA